MSVNICETGMCKIIKFHNKIKMSDQTLKQFWENQNKNNFRRKKHFLEPGAFSDKQFAKIAGPVIFFLAYDLEC